MKRKVLKKLILLMVSLMLLSGCVVNSNSSSEEEEDHSSISVGKWNLNLNLGKGTTYRIDEEKVISLKEIEDLNISSISADIEFHRIEEGEDLKVHFHGKVKTSSKNLPYLEVLQKGSKLTVNIIRKDISTIGINSENLKLDIYLPEKEYEYLKVNSVSGGIKIDEVKAKDFRAETISGGIKLKTVEANSSVIESTSGKIAVADLQGNLRAKTISGAIEVLYREFQNNVEITSVSGGIELRLPKDSEFNLKANTTSGKLEGDFLKLISREHQGSFEGAFTHNNGKNMKNYIHLQTISGNIRVD